MRTRTRVAVINAAEAVASLVAIVVGFVLLRVARTYESYPLVFLAITLVLLGLLALLPTMRPGGLRQPSPSRARRRGASSASAPHASQRPSAE